MRIAEIFKKKKKGLSFEFFPPKTAEGRDGFMKVVHELRKYDPMYVSVTYGAGGSTQDRTKNTLMWIKEETDLTVMSHLTCIGATKDSMDALLKDYMANGIDNILALRGDPPRDADDIEAFYQGDFKNANDLVKFIKGYNGFSISVAVYPEGHQQSPSIEKDMEYTKQKIDAGAHFGITQMFFDNCYYYDFMDRAGKIGINVPILPGILPITDIKKVMEFAGFCKATVPQNIQDKMMPLCDNPEDMKKVGIELCIKQCEDLLKNGVNYLHFYSMNKSDAVSKIIDALGGYFEKG